MYKDNCNAWTEQLDVHTFILQPKGRIKEVIHEFKNTWLFCTSFKFPSEIGNPKNDVWNAISFSYTFGRFAEAPKLPLYSLPFQFANLSIKHMFWILNMSIHSDFSWSQYISTDSWNCRLIKQWRDASNQENRLVKTPQVFPQNQLCLGFKSRTTCKCITRTHEGDGWSFKYNKTEKYLVAVRNPASYSKLVM